MSGYEVDTATLREHAANVGRIAGEVEHAADAANQEGIGGTSPYGILFSPIAVPVIGSVCSLAKKMISGTGALGREMESSLQQNVELYELVERQIKESLKGVLS